MDDVAVVGVIAATGGHVQPGNRGVHFGVRVADGVVKGESEFQGEFGVRQPAAQDVGAQDVGAVVDVCVVAAGVAEEGGDTGVSRRRPGG